jgi:hypothetical protein
MGGRCFAMGTIGSVKNGQSECRLARQGDDFARAPSKRSRRFAVGAEAERLLSKSDGQLGLA